MKRYPMRVRAWERRSRRPLPPKSRKRLDLYDGPGGRREFVRETLAENPYCQARIEGVCTGRSQDVHELIRRSHGGEIVPGPRAEAQGQVFMAVCRPCHNAITLRPAWARANGFEKR